MNKANNACEQECARYVPHVLVRRLADVVFLVALALGITLLVMGQWLGGIACLGCAVAVAVLIGIRLSREGRLPGQPHGPSAPGASHTDAD